MLCLDGYFFCLVNNLDSFRMSRLKPREIQGWRSFLRDCRWGTKVLIASSSVSLNHCHRWSTGLPEMSFMSIAVRKNHLPGIGAHSVEKGLKINIHTITHLKYIVFNMWRERHIFYTIVTTHNRTTSEESVGVIYNLTWLSMSIMVSQERFKLFAMKHLTHRGLKLFPCQVTPWLASIINK